MISTLHIKRAQVLEGIKQLETVIFDLALLRRSLTEEKEPMMLESLNRIAGDLNMPNQLYYFKNGRYWLYRGSMLLSEGALGQLLMFKDRADRMNLHRVSD